MNTFIIYISYIKIPNINFSMQLSFINVNSYFYINVNSQHSNCSKLKCKHTQVSDLNGPQFCDPLCQHSMFANASGEKDCQILAAHFHNILQAICNWEHTAQPVFLQRRASLFILANCDFSTKYLAPCCYLVSLR